MIIKIRTKNYTLMIDQAPRARDVYHVSIYNHDRRDVEIRVGTLWPRSYGVFELTLAKDWRQKYADLYNDGVLDRSDGRIYARVASAQGLIQYFFDVLDPDAKNDADNAAALDKWDVLGRSPYLNRLSKMTAQQ